MGAGAELNCVNASLGRSKGIGRINGVSGFLFRMVVGSLVFLIISASYSKLNPLQQLKDKAYI